GQTGRVPQSVQEHGSLKSYHVHASHHKEKSMKNNAETTASTHDLVLERYVDVPPAKVWEAWTTPEILMKWFTPDPWKTISCEMDLVPGGKANTTMQSPDGQEFPNTG